MFIHYYLSLSLKTFDTVTMLLIEKLKTCYW